MGAISLGNTKVLAHNNNSRKTPAHRKTNVRKRRVSRPVNRKVSSYNFEKARMFADSTKSMREFDIPFNTTFTNSEIMWVKVRTPKMFGSNQKIHIDLSDLSDTLKWHMPLPGCKVISPFGGRRKHHSGADLKTKPNDYLYAVFDGVVRLSRVIGGYGNVITIRHTNGLETVYSHNSRNFVSAGDTVRAGDIIGLTGRTGRATTEHCHFELRINGQALNPEVLFDFAHNTIKSGVYVATPAGSLKRLADAPENLVFAFSDTKEVDLTDSVAVAKDLKERDAYAKSVYTHARKSRYRRHTSHRRRSASATHRRRRR